MRRLASGPMTIREGPIGRCVKRRWCYVMIEPLPDGKGSNVIFGLTEMGRALVAD